MNRTYIQMQSNVGTDIQDTSTNTKNIIKRCINNAYLDALRRYNWEFHNYEYSFVTVAGTKDYILPRDFGKELYVVDDTNNLNIQGKTLQRMVKDCPGVEDDQGSVYEYAILHKRVIKQPTSASPITIVSTSSSDTSQSVFLRGIVDGVEVTEELVLSGMTEVTSTKLFTSIIHITKSAETVGRVIVAVAGTTGGSVVDELGETITDELGNPIGEGSGTDAIIIGIISPEVLDYRVTCIRFHYVPSSSITILVPYKISPLPLNYNYDAPLLPSDVIELGAVANIWRYKRQYAKAQEYERLFEKALMDLIWEQENNLNRVNTFDVLPYSRETV